MLNAGVKLTTQWEISGISTKKSQDDESEKN